MTNQQDAMEAAAAQLSEQMEAQADDTTPSLIMRDRGLVWLEGWFDLGAAVQAYLAAREAEGFVMVPVEPTEEMLCAAQEAYEPDPEYGISDADMLDALRAMLAARPTNGDS